MAIVGLHEDRRNKMASKERARCTKNMSKSSTKKSTCGRKKK